MGLAGSETFSESELEDGRRASGGTRPQDASLLTDSLLTDEESLATFQDRWDRLQVRFVEEPGRAAVDAEDLIRDIAAALAASTVRRRADLAQVSPANVRFPEELWTTLQRCRLLMTAIEHPR